MSVIFDVYTVLILSMFTHDWLMLTTLLSRCAAGIDIHKYGLLTFLGSHVSAGTDIHTHGVNVNYSRLLLRCWH